jgi:CRISPR-associated Csx2 family protein
MAKILISALGTGPLNRNAEAARSYRTAKYKLEEREYENSFIAAVLYQHLELDGIIFIGTVKSMWEEAYRFFCEQNSIEPDQDYYFSLAETIDNLNYQSPLDSIDLSRIEKVLGDNSHCIKIKYGLDDGELWDNFEAIIRVLENLNDGDEIYIDITHSFRSTSMFMFLIMTFINELAADRNIEIKSIYYGMLDVIRELQYAPVVNLQPLFDLTKWVKGAYTLKNFGDGELISQLLQAQGEEKIAGQIKELSDAININYLTAIKEKSTVLDNSLIDRTTSNPFPSSNPFKYLQGVLEKFVKQFRRREENESDFQLRLAQWYFKNRRFAAGYITLTEAILTYLCEVNNLDSKSKRNRDNMKDMLHQKSYKTTNLAQIYFEVNKIRMSAAHALTDKKIKDYKVAISNAEEDLNKVKRIFKTGMLNG